MQDTAQALMDRDIIDANNQFAATKKQEKTKEIQVKAYVSFEYFNNSVGSTNL